MALFVTLTGLQGYFSFVFEVDCPKLSGGLKNLIVLLLLLRINFDKRNVFLFSVCLLEKPRNFRNGNQLREMRRESYGRLGQVKRDKVLDFGWI